MYIDLRRSELRCLSTVLCGFLYIFSFGVAPTSGWTVGYHRSTIQTRVQSTSSDSLGFSSKIRTSGYAVRTHLIFGSNSIEHGVNLLEEAADSALILYGWNAARIDTLLWELEPRGFTLSFYSLPDRPTEYDIVNIIKLIVASNCKSLVAVGCGRVLDIGKIVATIFSTDLSDLNMLNGYLCKNKIIEMLKSENFSFSSLFFCSVPLLPSYGAELSTTASLSCTNSINEANALSKFKIKSYLTTVQPDLCLVSPGNTHRAQMIGMNERIICLMAVCFDIIVSDDGFIPEMIAYDSLHRLVGILEIAVQVRGNR